MCSVIREAKKQLAAILEDEDDPQQELRHAVAETDVSVSPSVDELDLEEQAPEDNDEQIMNAKIQ